MHPEMEKTCTAFLCVLFCWWRTSLELASYQGQGRSLAWDSISACSLSGKSTLENKYHLWREVQGHSAVHINKEPSETGVQVRLKARTEGMCRQVGEFRCDTDGFLCRQERRNFTALATNIYSIWRKLCLSNSSYMEPELPSPRSKSNL